MRKPSKVGYSVLIFFMLFLLILDAIGNPALLPYFGGATTAVILLCVADYLRRNKKYGVAQSCPSCRAPYAENVIKREELNRRVAYETIPRVETTTGEIRDWSDTDTTKWKTQQVRSTTTRLVQVHMTYVTYLNYLRCPFCGHQWTKVSTIKREG